MTTGTMAAVGAHARRSFRIRPTTALVSSLTTRGEHPVRRHRHHHERLMSSSALRKSNNGMHSYRSLREARSCHQYHSIESMTNRSLAASVRNLSSESDQEKEEGTKSTTTQQTEENTSSSAAPIKISMDELLALASCQPTALSLADMYQYAPKKSTKNSLKNAGKGNNFVDIGRLRNAQFLHKELPIRIAQRAIDLLTLPHGLNRTREVQSIANTYLQYLQQLPKKPTNAETEKVFTAKLKDFILDRHSIPMAIARGIQSLKDNRKAPVDARRLAEMEEALNRFFTARVGLRFLVEHHVLSGNDENSDALYRKQLEAEGGLELLDNDNHLLLDGDEDCCGAIQKNCDPVKEVKRTVARVTRLCRESYGIAPEVEIVESTEDTGDAEVSFTYVPHHLRYMLAELLKNSCRATVKK